MNEIKSIDDITKEEVLLDLEKYFNRVKDIFEGNLIDNRLSKDGAFKRMQVYNYIINKLK